MFYYLICGILAYLCWLYINLKNAHKKIDFLPGPKFSSILFGNLFQLGTSPADYLHVYRAWCAQFDFKIFRFWTGPQPYVVIPNTEGLEFVLSSTTLTYKADFYDFLRPWLGNGLLTSSGQKWLKQRKMITPSFHFQVLQDFLHIINETTDRFVKHLETYANKGDVFDMQEVVKCYTMDVICETAMGTKVNSIEGKLPPIVRAMEVLSLVIVERVFSLLKRPDILFFFHPSYWRQKQGLKIMREELFKIIDARKKILKDVKNFEDSNTEFKRPKMAFLDTLLTSEIDGKKLTYEQIFEEVSTFMFEGHDTTAASISFTIFCLSRHPNVQKKVYEEQLMIFGNDTSRSPTHQDLQDMKYLDLVIKESLRIFPSVPFISRTLQQETTISGNVIPENTTIVLPLIVVGTNESNFSEPFKFDPERFDVDKRTNYNPFQYVPFSAGPRNCIGQKFAMMELKVTLSKIIRHFECLPPMEGLKSGIYDPAKTNEKPHFYDPKLAFIVTLKSANGIHIRLKKRN